MILTILLFILILGVIVLIHEGGHFLVAKACKIRVNEFAIGFGPTIWKKQGKETKYALDYFKVEAPQYIESVERQQQAYLDISDKCGILLHEIDTEKNYRVPRKLYRGLCNMRYDDESSKFAKGLYDLERMMSKAEKENRANIGNRNNLKINLDSSKGKQPNQFSL